MVVIEQEQEVKEIVCNDCCESDFMVWTVVIVAMRTHERRDICCCVTVVRGI